MSRRSAEKTRRRAARKARGQGSGPAPADVRSWRGDRPTMWTTGMRLGGVEEPPPGAVVDGRRVCTVEIGYSTDEWLVSAGWDVSELHDPELDLRPDRWAWSVRWLMGSTAEEGYAETAEAMVRDVEVALAPYPCDEVWWTDDRLDRFAGGPAGIWAAAAAEGVTLPDHRAVYDLGRSGG